MRIRGAGALLGVVTLACALSTLPGNAEAGGPRGGGHGFRGGHGGHGFHGHVSGGFKSPGFRSPRFRSHGFGGHRFTHPAPSVFPRHVDPWKSWGKPGHGARSHGFHGFVGSPFVPFVGGTAVVSAPSVVVPPPAVSYPELAVAAPVPGVIEYPNGWYQLRGDGVTSPYVWVWIPKPPPPPAEVPSTPEPPPAPPPARPEPPATELRSRHDEVAYRWTDERGVTNWTNRLDRVPPQYRDQARPVDTRDLESR